MDHRNIFRAIETPKNAIKRMQAVVSFITQTSRMSGSSLWPCAPNDRPREQSVDNEHTGAHKIAGPTE
jgi:hypothetical protein